tara:strand:+ start:318 stop:914 length:597 start_codon:yes stop_codon:yes gene_type:complete
MKAIAQNLELKILDSTSAKKSLIKNSLKIEKSIKIIFESISNNGKILLCGNGGSAADAQHLAAEFLVRLRPHVNRDSYPAMSLAMDTSTLTATGNDIGFNSIFSRTLSSLGKKGDVLIAISTSGKSKNIISALKVAKQKKIFSIAFLGAGGGLAKKYADLSIIVGSKITARIQEAHIFLGHFIFESVEDLILKKKNKN